MEPVAWFPARVVFNRYIYIYTLLALRKTDTHFLKGTRDKKLEINLALQHHLFEKLQAAHNFYAIAAAVLVPLAQPEKRCHLVFTKALER